MIKISGELSFGWGKMTLSCGEMTLSWRETTVIHSWFLLILMNSRLYELGLQAIDVGGAGDCFFRYVSCELYGNNNHHMQI